MLLLGCLLTGVNLPSLDCLPGLGHLIAMTFVGIGGGLIEASSDPLLIQLFPGRESTVMNLHHFSILWGLCGSPIIGSFGEIAPVAMGYIGFGYLCWLFFYFSDSRNLLTAKSSKIRLHPCEGDVKSTLFLDSLWVTFCTMGVQNSIAYWIVTFLKEERSFSIPLASASLSLFFVCMGVEGSFRVMSPRNYTMCSSHQSLLSPFCLSTNYCFCPWPMAVLFLMFCGFAQSAVFPCLLALAGKLYPQNPGTAMGLMSTGAGLGSMTVPWLLALVSQLTSLQTGFLFLDVFVLICLGLMGLGFKGFTVAQTQP